MSRYFVDRRAGTPDSTVIAAVSFLFVSCAIFMSAVIMQFGPETIASAISKQFRHGAVSLGWATPYVSLRLPPRRQLAAAAKKF